MLKNIIVKGLAVVFILGSTLPVHAQGITGLGKEMEYFLYGIVAFVVFALTITIHLILLRNKYEKAANLRLGITYGPSIAGKWRTNKKRVFYFTIIAGIILAGFFVINPKGKQRQQASNVVKVKETFDEKSLSLADEKAIDEGKKIFAGTCFACHGANGEGNAVGPNLTDKYWLHGGSIGEIFKTITNGVPDKGMQPWGKTFSPTEIKNVSNFILSLQGTEPANAKAPQGDLFEAGNETGLIAPGKARSN